MSALLLPVTPSWAVDNAQRPGSQPELRIVIEEGRLSVDIRETPLALVLRALSAASGLPITMQGDLSAPVSAAFSNLTLGEGLRRLLRMHSIVLIYEAARDEMVADVEDRQELIRAIVVGEPLRATSGSRVGARTETRVELEPVMPGRGRAPPPTSAGRGLDGRGSAPTPRDVAAGAHASGGGGVADLGQLQTRLRDGDRAAITELAQLLASAQNPLARAQAAALLGLAGGDIAAAALRDALNDPDGAVRMHAVRALGQIERDRALPTLADIVERDPDPRVRRAAVRWLGAIPGPGVQSSLQAAMLDADATVRQEATRALAGFGRSRGSKP